MHTAAQRRHPPPGAPDARGDADRHPLTGGSAHRSAKKPGSTSRGFSGPFTKVNRCLAEGRKSFLARYAGIEAGEECRRLAPVLSALVDGEATPEQLVELRPHLRNCGACKAALRELHGTNESLAALFPLGGLALLGAGDGPDVGGVVRGLAGAWRALWAQVGDRAAVAALRVQSVVPGMVPGRTAAVAASVVALGVGATRSRRARPRTRRRAPAPFRR